MMVASVVAPAALGLSCAPDMRESSAPAVADQVNQLQGHPVVTSPGVLRAERISDGTLAPLGDFWNTPLTAILPSAESFITVDLGAPVAIAAAFVEGDNNDRYIVSGSLDGVTFTPIWDAQPVHGAGMRPRRSDKLSAQARYIRLSAAGGDGAYSVGELEVFSTMPSVWPEPPSGNAAAVEGPLLAEWIMFFGAACVVFLLFGCHGGPRRALVVGLAPAIAAVLLLSQIAGGGERSFNDHDVSFLRAMVAAVGVLAVVRPFMRVGKGTVDGRRITVMLGMLAVFAVACFFNLGRAQFWDAKLRKPSYIHNYDMRVYFPVAKYFHELRYDGLYLASVAAYIENTPGASVHTLADVELRDLHNHAMRRVRDVADEIGAVKTRFSPQRWDEFKQDMRYFHETMGRDYFSTLTDHGGNATPVWLLIAHFLFGHVSAGNGVLFATALLDPLLILLFAIVIGRTYGWKTAFVCLIVFGANDVYMFGTNWSGSTLRNDWMVAVGLGAAALKQKRWRWAGFLLGYAGLIRAFPAITVLGLLVPPLWWIYDRWRADGQLPSLRAVVRAHEGTARTLVAVAVTVAVLAGLSAVVLSPSAWIGWAKKAAVLTGGLHVNHVSLRSVIGADLETWDTIETWYRSGPRVVLFVLAATAFGVLTVRASRGRPPEQASLIAMFLLPVVTYAANYYFHFVFLLPLLVRTEGTRREDATIWAFLLAMCVFEYGTTFAQGLAGHFVGESACLLVTFLAVLWVLAKDAKPQAALTADSAAA
jgi:ABC-type proline/glycine betaine transport system permease subunit